MLTKHPPHLGVGLSYRRSFGTQVFEYADSIGLIELVADNVPGTLSDDLVASLAKQFPIVCHSLDLSVGTDEPVDTVYIDRIAQVVELVGAHWLSDHFAMTRVGGLDLGHLVPVAFSRQSVDIIAANIEKVRRRIGVPLAFENISYYMLVPGGDLSEWEFLNQVCQAADCGLLLDLNNLYVNANNHHYDPYEFLNGIPLHRVTQLHLAGSQVRDGLIVDSHSEAVGPEVWQYLEWVLARCKPSGIILEWDRGFPAFDILIGEIAKAAALFDSTTALVQLPGGPE